MTIDPSTMTTIVGALAAIVVLLAVWVAILHRSHAALRRRLRRIVAGEERGLDQILDQLAQQVEQNTQRVGALNALQRELEGVVRRSIQRVGVVRFNPFADTGGDQSFAIALLDSDGNGLVISSLHGRADTRIFAKAVVAGRSRHQLSEEEQDAIARALAPAERA